MTCATHVICLQGGEHVGGAAERPGKLIRQHRSQSHEGTGLGLPLCKMFTELHGGRLSLTSKVGHGTTVSIWLPAERVIR